MNHWACHFRTLGGCSGRMDRAHWIPAQRLRKEHLTPEQVWDRRVWTWACRRHHHMWDNGFLRVTRDQLPAHVEKFAAEHDLLWSLDRDYGLREDVAA